MRLFVLLFLAVFTAFAGELNGKVIKVYDGDTIHVLDSNKQVYRVRLEKIDAPESKQDYGYQAKRYLASLIACKDVMIKYSSKDRYGRIIGIVYLNGIDINLEMVKAGYAWHYKHYDNTPEYAEAELLARKNKAGLWAMKNPANPYQFRQYQKGKSRKRR